MAESQQRPIPNPMSVHCLINEPASTFGKIKFASEKQFAKPFVKKFAKQFEKQFAKQFASEKAFKFAKEK